jgi:acyl carrier protein
MTAETTDAVFSTVKAALGEVLAAEGDPGLEITMESSFQADLEIESIDLVVLAEMLQESYPTLDFAEWIADMELPQILALRVGDLVDHIVTCLS